ncbi:MAG: YeeE/YedE family protein, partial [Candidatus Binatia bacterium]
MENFTPIPSLIGGILIGLSATATLALLGRVAGISGIVGGMLTGDRRDFPWRAAFVAGLLLGGAFT